MCNFYDLIDVDPQHGLQVLTRAAVDRGSRDNVTVVVVDLSPGGPEGECLASAASAMEDVMDVVWPCMSLLIFPLNGPLGVVGFSV